MTDRTYTQDDIEAAVAAALEKATDEVQNLYAEWSRDVPYCDQGEAINTIRNLRPDAACILRERDARVYAEALEAADRTDITNPYEGEG